MDTGFKGLDKFINLEEPQLILLTGISHIEELSGDIANNVCLKQYCNVLEIVGCKIGYILQRMFVNLADVDYKNWYLKDKYTNEELQKITINIEKIIEGTKKFPKIIEQELLGYDLKKISSFVENYANHFADRGLPTNALAVIDVYPLNNSKKTSNRDKYFFKRLTEESFRFIKKLKKISYKLDCPIIFIDNINISRKYKEKNHTWNYLTKEDIHDINRINKYIDKFVILNDDDTVEDKNIYNVDIYNKQEKIGSCKLEYNMKCRKFLDYGGE